MPDAYRWTLEGLLDEERRLRALAEAEVRAYRQLLLRLALRANPQAVETRRRQTPDFVNTLTVEEWMDLMSSPMPQRSWKVYAEKDEEIARLQQELMEAKAQRDEAVGRWQLAVGQSEGTAVGDLQLAVNQQHAHEIQETHGGVPSVNGPPAQTSDRQQPTTNSPKPIAISQSPTTAVHPPSPNGQQPTANSQPLRALSPLSSFSLPPLPPKGYAARFHTWPREGLVLALLALSGWSLRYAIDEAVAREVGISPGSGSMKRLFTRLETQRLVESAVYRVGDVQAAILTLSTDGVAVVRAMGLTPVRSDWAILMAEHGGPAQSPHAALCCVFAYQARRRGYDVTFCPRVDGPARPDLLLTAADERHYVEVESGSGDPERRMKKWRNQADLQGYAALCASSDAVRQRLVAEAKLAAKRGFATDIGSLIRGEVGGVWVEEWK